MDIMYSVVSCLGRGGYDVFLPIAYSRSLVIRDLDGRFSLVMVRRATCTDKTPVLSLSPRQQIPSFYEAYDYVLASIDNDFDAWLIPFDFLPMDAKTIRLGEKYEQFRIRPIKPEEDNFTKEVREAVQEKLHLTEAKALDILGDR